MLQHLFHRRGPSNPASPIPENNPWDTASLQPPQLVPEEGIPAPEIRPRSSTSAPYPHGHGQSPTALAPLPQQHQSQPPTLPPITRVISSESAKYSEIGNLEPRIESKVYDEAKPPPWSAYNEQSGFIGGLALKNYRWEQATQKPASPGDATSPDASAYKPHMPLSSPPQRPPPPVKPVKAASSFVSPTDLHAPAPTGKRPPGARTITDIQGQGNAPSAPEPQRGRKGLPFLKNPVSTLLLRRKTSQNIPELSIPPRRGPDEPSYDPRIRGTRVHDFSAPRPRKPLPANDQARVFVAKTRQDHVSPIVDPSAPAVEAPPVPPKAPPAQASPEQSVPDSEAPARGASHAQMSRDPGNTQASRSPKQDVGSTRSRSSMPLTMSSLSRNASEASSRDVLSSLPKHMKSTSSRFSFDMIGAAKQEKLLEERHRQRQQDKVADDSFERRDSRFDEFDEDAFDYDAMDDDDGLEERIPGVNADLDEEDDMEAADDPDNDQENFAGFVFQRSNPTSAITSPRSAGILPTPRDVNGNVIGYAMTGETPELEEDSQSSMGDPSEHNAETIPGDTTPTGLGIRGVETVVESKQPPAPQQAEPQSDAPKILDKDDELYFNDGLIHNFDGEGDGSAFDESIFDLDDTDQYGRPIPGMFANALARRNATDEVQKRESDITSRLSAQSGASQTTAHTSLSANAQSKSMDLQHQDEQNTKGHEPQELDEPAPAPEGQMAAYQAALAAATHKAAAAGKFRRDSSPIPVAELTITSPTTSGSSHSHVDALDDSIDDFADAEGSSGGLDDYELDDDAIIAEANASALANDSDGWYGQEFGFYSAPILQTSHQGTSLLSEKNLYHYSHGGYFGPNGPHGDGRKPREPNLTPITERSEYSNRNSLMSPGMPAGAALQSPGLAQLAMMADDDNMSLSALLRLRTRAWGGSQASLSSSREASPHDRNDPTSPWSHDAGVPSHRRKNSAFSMYSQDSAAARSASGSPTMTMPMVNIPTNAIPPLNVAAAADTNTAVPIVPAAVFPPLQPSSNCPPVFEDEEMNLHGSPSSTAGKPFAEMMSPTVGTPSQKRPGVVGHRHRGSADSISYTREEDSGETRWILERRRTAESGEIEILGREVVGSGQI
ncbi:hypothetical protein GGR56DRAFT_634925 [Xylariaceae sp. FL0804]|nr:hypothetical protein GGR56DRAFT_634925 [Xylariaceae sp. FL0804]